jgi:RNase P/RNase MRP subunit p29
MKRKYRLIDFIGREVKIIRSTNKSAVGMEGKIVDDGKHYFLIERIVSRENKKIKKLAKVMKKGTIFEIDGEIIDGSDILNTPEER